MQKNLGISERRMRAIAAAGLLTCGYLGPVPYAVRLLVFGTMGIYLLITALSGSCAIYGVLGKSTCSARAQK